jgi:hypothetical protein
LDGIPELHRTRQVFRSIQYLLLVFFERIV